LARNNVLICALELHIGIHTKLGSELFENGWHQVK
jgi:hypothetical protein